MPLKNPRPEHRCLLFIILDGFDYSYLKHTPFIARLAEKNLGIQLNIPFGFCNRGILFSGTYPQVNNTFADYWYIPKSSRFKLFRHVPGIAHTLWRHPSIKTMIRIGVRILSGYPAHIPDKITLRDLSYFDVPGPAVSFIKFDGSGRIPNLIDLMRQNQIRFRFFGSPFRKMSTAVERHIGQYLKDDLQVLLIHYVSPDHYGHRYGPKSKQTTQHLTEMDKRIADLIGRINHIFKNLDICMVSDHGMCEVCNYVDMSKELNRLDLRLYKDYVLFLDSTMARFWFMNDRARQKVTRLLGELDHGHIVSDAERQKHQINFRHQKFGELIFCLDRGGVIAPSFYGGRVKGMHGYLHDRDGLFLLKTDREIRPLQKVSLVDVFPTIIDLLHIETPPTCQGMSALAC